MGLKLVSELLGHSGIAITSDVYGSLAAEAKRATADAMDGIFAAYKGQDGGQKGGSST